jgi:hypothetical protein
MPSGYDPRVRWFLPGEAVGPPADSVERMEEPIVVWLTEQDEANLAIIEATGVSREDAIRAAITHMAAECTPVVWALGRSVSTT